MAAEERPVIRVEVAYALPDRQTLLTVELPSGSTVAEAIEASGIRDHAPELRVEPGTVGIFSRKVAPEQVLKDGDRVEIYRPLQADPKEIRRKRAAEGSKKHT